jgi:hypothetical protein
MAHVVFVENATVVASGAEKRGNVAAADILVDHQAYLCREIEEAAWGQGGGGLHGSLVGESAAGAFGLR